MGATASQVSGPGNPKPSCLLELEVTADSGFPRIWPMYTSKGGYSPNVL